MKLLALDLATTCGWHCAGQGGVVSFSRRKPLSTIALEHHADIGSRFSSWLSGMIDEHRPALLVIEAVPARGKIGANTTDLQKGLRLAAGIVGWRHDLLMREVYPNTWQAWAGKRGWTKADKSDEADARWLHEYAVDEFMPYVREAA